MELYKELKKEDLYKERVIKRFAFLPVKLDNGSVIWLEHYKVLQIVYEHDRLVDYYLQPIYFWFDIKKYR